MFYVKPTLTIALLLISLTNLNHCRPIESGHKIPYDQFLKVARQNRPVVQYGVPGGPWINKLVHSMNCPVGTFYVNWRCRRVFRSDQSVES